MWAQKAGLSFADMTPRLLGGANEAGTMVKLMRGIATNISDPADRLRAARALNIESELPGIEGRARHPERFADLDRTTDRTMGPKRTEAEREADEAEARNHQAWKNMGLDVTQAAPTVRRWWNELTSPETWSQKGFDRDIRFMMKHGLFGDRSDPKNDYYGAGDKLKEAADKLSKAADKLPGMKPDQFVYPFEPGMYGGGQYAQSAIPRAQQRTFMPDATRKSTAAQWGQF